MIRRSHTPHATLVREIREGTYEVISEHRSVTAALKTLLPEIYTAREIRSLRIVEYLGQNLFQMCPIAVDRWAARRMPAQLSLPL